MICETCTAIELKVIADFHRAGQSLMTALEQEGLDNSGITTLFVGQHDDNIRTAQYVSVNDAKKDLVVAMADMSIFSSSTTGMQSKILNSVSNSLSQIPWSVKWFIADANFHPMIVRAAMVRAKELSSKVKVAFEPVSVAKSAGFFRPSSNKGVPHIKPFPNHLIDLATPNQHELASMHEAAKEHEHFASVGWWETIDALGIPSTGARDRFVALTSSKMTDQGIPLQTIQLLPLIPTILTKLGPEGVLLTELLKPTDRRLRDPDHAPFVLSRNSNGSKEVGGVYMRLFPAVEVVDDVVSVNGVGDTFLGILVAGLASGVSLDKTLINIAQKGAVMTLRSKDSVSPELLSLKGRLESLAQR